MEASQVLKVAVLGPRSLRAFHAKLDIFISDLQLFSSGTHLVICAPGRSDNISDREVHLSAR